MTTKEKIAYEALTLFSKNGYKGTSVKMIAEAVGIKDSSLYKHYKSKQEILDTIMQALETHITEMFQQFGLPTGFAYEKAGAFYGGLDEAELVASTRKIVLFYLKDDLLSKFWRMGMMEQFQNERVYALFRTFFLEDSIQYQSQLFAEMSRQNILVEADPEEMAMSFYAPIFFLLSKYAGREGSEDEVLRILDKQVKAFYRVYRKRE